ncbi:MAG TPA: glycerophosphodiester phosphodiesterase family protein [Ignavibacteriaceae bacterium]|nr:glycerophosphodiester phosphodiesterase family protein [Ignavibacteriaceae bacterium]
MKKYLIILFIISFGISGCDRIFDVDYPEVDPSGFLTQTHPLTDLSKKVIEGVYSVQDGNGYFGDTIVLKYSGDNLSIFTNKNACYMLIKAGSLDSVIFFEGYWRYSVNSDVGRINFYISSFEGGSQIMRGDTSNRNIIVHGSYGDGDNVPGYGFKIKFERPFSQKVNQNDFYILAHRGGGRNSDFLPASENSIELISYAERLGANGIEIDVQLTKDGIPIIYHDEDINLRLTQKSVIWGDIEDYTLAQLRTFIKLKNGEMIPTLEEALDYVVDHTNLRFVWLDLKSHYNEVNAVAEIQARLIKKLNAKKRDLKIVIGIPTRDKANFVLALRDYSTTPTLCELGTDVVREINSQFWAPRWTQGVQTDLVNLMHAENRKAFVWTLDDPGFIENFFSNGNFDGMLTNYPMLVAYHHYTRKQ